MNEVSGIPSSAGAGRRPAVAVLGAGFGGLRVAKRLARAPVDVTLIDRTNYHLFQPLLYQVAAAYLDPGQIAQPVRAILRGQRNVRFLMAEALEVDLAARVIRTSRGPVGYDELVIAVGSETNYRGLESVRRLGFGLKTLADGIAIRNHILTCFERAILSADAAERRALLTFAVVGGGPTGIEMAGALAELIEHVLVRDFPEVRRDEHAVVLLEAADRLLPGSAAGTPAWLGERAARTLRGRGIDVRLRTQVTGFDGRWIGLGSGERLGACTIIWSAGVRGAPLASRLGLPVDGQNRIPVQETLEVQGHPGVYAIGDVARIDRPGVVVPMVAPAAVQMADAAALNIVRRLDGKEPVPFVYKDLGTMTAIGKNAAVAWVWGIRFGGFAAWVIWLVVHIIRLMGFRNRAVVLLSWALDYFFNERAVRVITGEPGPSLREEPTER